MILNFINNIRMSDGWFIVRYIDDESRFNYTGIVSKHVSVTTGKIPNYGNTCMFTEFLS